MAVFDVTVRQKLVFIVVLTIAGLLTVAYTVFTSSASIQHMHDSKSSLFWLKVDLLQLRRDEKDFLLRLDDEYVGRFSESYKAMITELDVLRNLLAETSVDTSMMESMREQLDTYETRFQALVRLKKIIGYRSDQGLYGELRAAVHQVEEQLSESPTLQVSMLMLRRYEKDFMLRRQAKYIDRFSAEIENFRSLLALQEESSLDSLVNRYERGFQKLTQAEIEAGLDVSQGVAGEMREAAHELGELFQMLEPVLAKQIESRQTAARNLMVATLIIVAVVVAIGVAFIAVSIFKPLTIFSGEIISIMESKDLSRQVTVNGHDEISAVAAAFNELLMLLHEMMGKINDAALLVASSAEEMSMVTREVKDASESQSREVEQAAVAVDQMSATINEIAHNASTAADSVNVVHQQLQEGGRIGGEARDEIQLLTQEVQQAALAIQALEKNSENIGQVLDAIQNVAEQTNLLALNAAIEAARAGEQGRGFAVVADEVRTLAQRTQESTETIRQTISEFQQGTNQVVATVSHSNQRAETGIERVTRTTEILNEISGMVGTISDMNIQIAAAAEQQGVSASEISQNVSRVTELSRGVSSQTEQTSQASDELAKLGASLRDMVSVFRV